MKYFSKLTFALATVILCKNAICAVIAVPALLPSTVLPDTVIRTLATHSKPNPSALPPQTEQKASPASPLGSEAAKVTFRLTKIILEDNHVYTEAQLLPLYKDKLNKTINVVELQGIVQGITNYYRNEGYILTRAILPPQHVTNGIVKIKVIEGYINQVNVIGSPKGAKVLLQSYGNKIIESKPLQMKVLEKYLLLANQVPGTQVKGVLEPSKKVKGASDLNFVTQVKTFSAYTSFDNYGTLYLGPNEFSAGAEMDSIFRPGDSTQFSMSTTSRPQEMKFGQLMYNTPLGANGARLIFSGNEAKTRPGLTLRPLFIKGTANTILSMIQYPLIRSRTHNLTMDGSFNYIESKVLFTPFSEVLYVDHLRTLRIGANYDLSDSWKGTNNVAAHIETGIPVLGYTTEAQGNSEIVKTSRPGASNHFAKIDMQLSRLQQLGASQFSLFGQLKAQYAMEPLLSAEQFAFGGAAQALGRGYDPAEIIGDKGFAGSVEVRMNLMPGKRFLQAAQLYVFYDAGVVFNKKDIVGLGSKSSATSTGFGTRISFTSFFSGNILVGQPLTRQVDTLAVANKNRRLPRIFFSVSAIA